MKRVESTPRLAVIGAGGPKDNRRSRSVGAPVVAPKQIVRSPSATCLVEVSLVARDRQFFFSSTLPDLRATGLSALVVPAAKFLCVAHPPAAPTAGVGSLPALPEAVEPDALPLLEYAARLCRLSEAMLREPALSQPMGPTDFFEAFLQAAGPKQSPFRAWTALVVKLLYFQSTTPTDEHFLHAAELKLKQSHPALSPAALQAGRLQIRASGYSGMLHLAALTLSRAMRNQDADWLIDMAHKYVQQLAFGRQWAEYARRCVPPAAKLREMAQRYWLRPTALTADERARHGLFARCLSGPWPTESQVQFLRRERGLPVAHARELLANEGVWRRYMRHLDVCLPQGILPKLVEYDRFWQHLREPGLCADAGLMTALSQLESGTEDIVEAIAAAMRTAQ